MIIERDYGQTHITMSTADALELIRQLAAAVRSTLAYTDGGHAGFTESVCVRQVEGAHTHDFPGVLRVRVEA